MYHNMKKLLLILLLSSLTFAQSGKSVLTDAQKDSINAMIITYIDTANVSDAVTPEDYFAVGDGVTSDSIAFKNMFDDNPSYIKLENDKVYKLGYQQALLNADSTIIIDGNGATIDLQGYFLTFTSGASWVYGATTYWKWTHELDEAAIADTLFSANFIEGNQYVEIADINDWNGNGLPKGVTVKKGDLLLIETSTTGGGVFAIDRVTDDKLYFQNTIRYDIDKSDITDLRFVDCGGKNIIVKNLNIKNGGIRVAGFENAIIENVHCDMDSTTWQSLNLALDANKQTVAGIQVLWNKNATIRDCTAEGFLLTGHGYGINTGMGLRVLVDNFNAIDCRHGITTTSIGGRTLNDLFIVNSSYRMSARGRTIITSNTGAFDTHAGVNWTYIDNCYAENSEDITKLRGENLSIQNSIFRDITTVVDVEDANLTKNIFIDNNKFYNCGGLDIGENIRINNLFINNNRWQLYNAEKLITSAYNGILIDTAGINNNFIYGDTPVNSDEYGILFSLQDTIVIDQANITNNSFTNLRVLWVQKHKNIKTLNFLKNTVTNGYTVGYYFDTTSVSDGSKWTFKDNVFNNTTETFNTVDGRLTNWVIENNVFNDCAYGISFEGVTADTVLIINNTIRNNLNGYVFYADSCGYMLISGNTVIGTENADAYKETVFKGYVAVTDNTFYFDATNYQSLGLFSIPSGSELTISDNRFFMSGEINHIIVKGVSGATINWGTNRYLGTTTPLDTTGVTATTLSTFGD